MRCVWIPWTSCCKSRCGQCACERYTPKYHLIGAEQFEMMKKGAIFINLSRGYVVDIDALAAYLHSGKIKGAAIDVFPVEPEAVRCSSRRCKDWQIPSLPPTSPAAPRSTKGDLRIRF